MTLSLPCWAKQYLAEEEALQKAFPEAKEFVRDEKGLSDDQRRDVEKRLGRDLGADRFAFHAARAGDRTLGWGLFVDEIGKTLPITFLVAVGADGKIQALELVEFRETRGDGIARRSFREQFAGKTLADPLKPGKDIRSVSSSTMSAGAACLAARKALLLCEVFYLNAANPDGKPRTFKKTAFRMGTHVEIEVISDDAKNADAAIEKALAEITRIENLISHFKPDSEVSKINAAKGEWVPVSQDTSRCILGSIFTCLATDGAFDVTVGPLVELWGFGAKRQPPRVPSDQELAQALKRVGLANIEMERDQAELPKRVRVREGSAINLSAIGEGYAIDKALEVLKKEGVTQALVNIGGDLYVLGAPLPGGPSRVAIRHPRDKEKVAAALTVGNAAVCTSGDAEKFFEIGGKRYSHILDPRTGRPVPWQGSVTVVAPCAVDADALATALYVLGPEKGVAWIDREPQKDTPAQFDLPSAGSAALWLQILPDGSLKQIASKRMRRLLEK